MDVKALRHLGSSMSSTTSSVAVAVKRTPNGGGKQGTQEVMF